MGCYDTFCFICGNTCHSFDKSFINNIDKKFIKETLWLSKCIFLTNTNKVIHNCREVGCNIVFKDKKQNEYYQDIHREIYIEIENKPNNGIFLHTDCWNFVKKNYKIELKYSDVPIIISPRKYDKINQKIKYDKIEKYWSQSFKFEELFMDKNEYMCISPLKDSKNALRIKKIISQFKFNQDVKRKGPSVSASFYPEKSIKYGINGLLWIKKNGKWNEIKDSKEKRKIIIDEYKLNNKQKDYLKKLVCFGEDTSIPLVIINIKKLKDYTLEIELQGTVDELNNLDKLNI